jgi:hypothetical protein
MCYMIVVSTDSDKDLTCFNSSLMRFSRQMPKFPRIAFLQHPYKWCLESRDGCGCGFRHLDHENIELGFSEPEDWWPEDADDIAATMEAVSAFKTILADGARLDCIAAWTSNDIELEPLNGADIIELTAMEAASFRFFEGHRFELTATSPSSPA